MPNLSNAPLHYCADIVRTQKLAEPHNCENYWQLVSPDGIEPSTP